MASIQLAVLDLHLSTRQPDETTIRSCFDCDSVNHCDTRNLCQDRRATKETVRLFTRQCASLGRRGTLQRKRLSADQGLFRDLNDNRAENNVGR